MVFPLPHLQERQRVISRDCAHGRPSSAEFHLEHQRSLTPSHVQPHQLALNGRPPRCGFGLVDFRETRIPAKRLYQDSSRVCIANDL